MSADVEALGEWLANYLGNYTLPANYVAPLYGQTHREVAKYVGPVIAEDLLASDWLAGRDAEMRAEGIDHAAQMAALYDTGEQASAALAVVANVVREVTR